MEAIEKKTQDNLCKIARRRCIKIRAGKLKKVIERQNISSRYAIEKDFRRSERFLRLSSQ